MTETDVSTKRQQYSDRHLESWGFTGGAVAGRKSPFGQALDALTLAAANHDAAGAPPLAVRLGEAVEIVDEIKFAADAVETSGPEQGRLWAHRPDPMGDLRSEETPKLQRDEVERVVGRYLSLPYRSSHIDRLLVDLLVAQEMFAYGSLILNTPSIPGIENPYAALKIKPGRKWAIGLLVDWAVAAGVAVLATFLSSQHILPSPWLPIVLAGIAVLVGLGTVWSILRLPAYVKRVRQTQRAISEPLSAMVDVYLSLGSAGPLSAAHTLEKVTMAERSAGVGWPSSLYPLLNDVLARGDRF